MYQSRINGEPHSVAYVAVFLDIPKPTLYRWMQQGDLPYEDYGGLTDRHISIEDTMRVKAVKRPGRPKKRDAERVRNRPVNYELGRYPSHQCQMPIQKDIKHLFPKGETHYGESIRSACPRTQARCQ